MNEQSFRPLGLGEIIDTAFKVYTRHWRPLILIVAIAVVPAGIASYLILNAAVPPDLAGQLSDPTPVIDEALLDDILLFFGAAVLAAVIESGAALLASAGAVRAVAEIYLGTEPDWRTSLSTVLRRLAAIVATGVLILIAIGFLSAAAWILAGITASVGNGSGALAAVAVIAWMIVVPWLAVSWALAIPVLVIEEASPAEALARSFNLVRGRWWPTFGVLLTSWLIVAVLSGIASRIILAFLPSGSGLVASMMVSVAISAVTTPFVVAVLAVLYFDRRARREPFDLNRLAADIGAPAPTSRAEAPDPQLPAIPDRPDWPPLPPDPDREDRPPAD